MPGRNQIMAAALWNYAYVPNIFDNLNGKCLKVHGIKRNILFYYICI